MRIRIMGPPELMLTDFQADWYLDLDESTCRRFLYKLLDRNNSNMAEEVPDVNRQNSVTSETSC